MAFGEAVNPVYDFRKADVVLSLDADFLQCSPGSLRYAADFMARRRARTTPQNAATARMNRLGSYAHGGEHGGYYMPVVELQLDGRKVRAPVWIMPGHADRSVTVCLGHGP